MSVARVCGALAIVAGVAGTVGCGGGEDDDARCGPREAVVERVVDGDTIVLAGGQRVRYLLVDTPESTNGNVECFGAEASRFNSDLVLGRTVELTYDGPCLDRFGRTLAFVAVDGGEVNRRLVEDGYACVLHIAPGGDDRAGEFADVETTARAAGRGLWGACTPNPCD